MKDLDFDAIIKELNVAPNLYKIYKESLNTMSKDDLLKFANKIEKAFSKYISKYIKEHNLDEEMVLKFINENKNSGLSYDDSKKLKNVNDTINVLLNDVQTSLDNKIELIPKQNNNFFSDILK